MQQAEKRIAILGATSHIAKGLISALLESEIYELFLFARSQERVHTFLESIGTGSSRLVTILPFSDFADHEYGTVINCVGIGNPTKLVSEVSGIFKITEEFDNLVLYYIKAHCNTLYINFSSGAAYGTDFSSSVDEESQSRFNINAISASEYYGIVKVNSEAKHRAMSGYNIVDIRVFGYFSRFIDLSTRYLMADVISALKSGSELVTMPSNIVRDYAHPADLLRFINILISHKSINNVYDLFSRKPITKFEILENFAADFGLRYRVIEDANQVTATGIKDHYYSLNHRASELGYEPQHTSLDALCSETKALL